jgi:hypothetical protein
MSVRRALCLCIASITLVGCGSRQLETGYTFTPLGASPAQRRAYYAGPFSPEARNAMMSESAESGPSNASRRPGQ